MAALVDAGAVVDATIHRLWETPEGKIVPIVLAKVRRGDLDSSVVIRRTVKSRTAGRRASQQSAPPAARGCATAGVLLLMVVFLYARCG